MGNTIQSACGRRSPEWQSRANCLRCENRELTLFADVPEDVLEAIVLPIDQFNMPAKTVLFRQGEAGRYVYTIRQGLVKLVQKGPSGTARIVGLLRKYAVAGLSTLVDHTYRHTAEILLPAKVCRIPVPVIQEISADQKSMVDRLLEEQQKSLDAATEIITLLNTGPAPSRVAHCLLRTLAEDEDDFCPALAREDMAALLGVTVETVSRTLAEFKRQGLVTEKQGVFTFNRAKLMDIASS